VRWLRATRTTEVGRTNIRREALGQAIDAQETDQLMARLEAAGVLKLVSSVVGPKGGNTKRRWQVNPALRR
jgi:hypothetical protein